MYIKNFVGCWIWLIAAWFCLPAMAADKYKLGEDVQVLYVGQWVLGTVRDTDKQGNVLCEFDFHNTTRQSIFKPQEVRRLYEADALTRGRQWGDASGKYNIKAALLKISNGKVELRSEDMKEISIAIDKLSAKDQSFVKQVQSKAGLAAVPIPKLPEVESFSDANVENIAGSGRKWSSREDAQTEQVKLTLDPDPVRRGLELKQAGTGFPAINLLEKVSSLIPLGGADNWILASIGESENQPTRLMWVSLTKQSVKRIQMLPAGEMLIDYHAASRQLLTYSQRKIDGDRFSRAQPVLTVWQAEPATEEPKPVASWFATLPNDTTWHHSAPWVRFASDSIILQRTETHRILAWDIKSRSLKWQTAQESFFAPEPRLSAGGKYLLLPEDSGLRICDSISGHILGQLPMNSCSGVSAHPGGNLLAVLNSQTLYIVDLTGNQPTRKLSANSVGTPFRANFDWVGDDLLSFDGIGDISIVLFSLKHQLPIWTYQFDADAFWAQTSSGARKRCVVDDHLVYAATFSVDGKRGLAVGAVLLPSGKASAALEAAKPEDFLITKLGARFRVEVTAIDHSNEIREALIREVTDNGWIYDPGSENLIQAEYKRGEPREIRYELYSVRSHNREVQSATITPYLANLKIFVGKDEVWSNMSSSGPPPLVSMQEGDTLQKEVDRSNQPMWSYFQSIDIPTEIFDPRKRGGLGSTAVTNRGLVESKDPRQ